MSLLDGTLSTQEFLDSQAHIWNQIFSYIKPLSIRCTIELGIPDVIHKHGKPLMLSELAHALSIPEPKIPILERLLRFMIHLNFFVKVKISDKDDKEGYWITPASRFLFKDGNASMVPFVRSIVDLIIPDLWSKWFLSTDDCTPFASTYGTEFWEAMEKNPDWHTFLHNSMASDAKLISIVLTKDCRHAFDGLKSIVDVGGGSGNVAKALVDTFPDLKCTVLDLPHVIAGLEGSENLTFVAGDMFEFIPPTDCVFMKWILHDWSDEVCVKILQNCRKAIPSKDNGGKVIIVDMVVDQEHGRTIFETQLFMDLNMMNVTHGKERTKQEWQNLFTAAGFSSYNITNALGLWSLIEVYP